MLPSNPAARTKNLTVKIKHKSRPAARKTNKHADPRSLGPITMAETPEASLLAAVIRQGVEDYANTPETLDFLTDRVYARKLDELYLDADQFFHEGGLEEFLAFFGIEEIFRAPAIIRTVERIFNKSNTVKPHAVAPSVIAAFEPAGNFAWRQGVPVQMCDAKGQA